MPVGEKGEWIDPEAQIVEVGEGRSQTADQGRGAACDSLAIVGSGQAGPHDKAAEQGMGQGIHADDKVVSPRLPCGLVLLRAVAAVRLSHDFGLRAVLPAFEQKIGLLQAFLQEACGALRMQ
jgi:hypothetical protein